MDAGPYYAREDPKGPYGRPYIHPSFRHYPTMRHAPYPAPYYSAYNDRNHSYSGQDRDYERDAFDNNHGNNRAGDFYRPGRPYTNRTNFTSWDASRNNYDYRERYKERGDYLRDDKGSDRDRDRRQFFNNKRNIRGGSANPTLTMRGGEEKNRLVTIMSTPAKESSFPPKQASLTSLLTAKSAESLATNSSASSAPTKIFNAPSDAPVTDITPPLTPLDGNSLVGSVAPNGTDASSSAGISNPLASILQTSATPQKPQAIVNPQTPFSHVNFSTVPLNPMTPGSLENTLANLRNLLEKKTREMNESISENKNSEDDPKVKEEEEENGELMDTARSSALTLLSTPAELDFNEVSERNYEENYMPGVMTTSSGAGPQHGGEITNSNMPVKSDSFSLPSLHPLLPQGMTLTGASIDEIEEGEWNSPMKQMVTPAKNPFAISHPFFTSPALTLVPPTPAVPQVMPTNTISLPHHHPLLASGHSSLTSSGSDLTTNSKDLTSILLSSLPNPSGAPSHQKIRYLGVTHKIPIRCVMGAFVVMMQDVKSLLPEVSLLFNADGSLVPFLCDIHGAYIEPVRVSAVPFEILVGGAPIVGPLPDKPETEKEKKEKERDGSDDEGNERKHRRHHHHRKRHRSEDSDEERRRRKKKKEKKEKERERERERTVSENGHDRTKSREDDKDWKDTEREEKQNHPRQRDSFSVGSDIVVRMGDDHRTGSGELFKAPLPRSRSNYKLKTNNFYRSREQSPETPSKSAPPVPFEESWLPLPGESEQRDTGEEGGEEDKDRVPLPSFLTSTSRKTRGRGAGGYSSPRGGYQSPRGGYQSPRGGGNGYQSPRGRGGYRGRGNYSGRGGRGGHGYSGQGDREHHYDQALGTYHGERAWEKKYEGGNRDGYKEGYGPNWKSPNRQWVRKGYDGADGGNRENDDVPKGGPDPFVDEPQHGEKKQREWARPNLKGSERHSSGEGANENGKHGNEANWKRDENNASEKGQNSPVKSGSEKNEAISMTTELRPPNSNSRPASRAESRPSNSRPVSRAESREEGEVRDTPMRERGSEAKPAGWEGSPSKEEKVEAKPQPPASSESKHEEAMQKNKSGWNNWGMKVDTSKKESEGYGNIKSYQPSPRSKGGWGGWRDPTPKKSADGGWRESLTSGPAPEWKDGGNDEKQQQDQEWRGESNSGWKGQYNNNRGERGGWNNEWQGPHRNANWKHGSGGWGQQQQGGWGGGGQGWNKNQKWGQRPYQGGQGNGGWGQQRGQGGWEQKNQHQ